MTEHAIPTDALRDWVRDLFLAMGSQTEEAVLGANHLVAANLAGHDSHGVAMLQTYVESHQAGFLQLNQRIELVCDAGALVIADGGMGLGQSMARQAMDVGIERAKEHGIALLGLRNSHHMGRIGHWAEQGMAAGLVSMHFTNAMTRTPVVAPHGGIDARFVTNPLTIGIPRADGEPLLLDFATSAIAHGKARVAMNSGKQVPVGSIIDADGRSTTDPNVLFDEPAGALKTFAEHKGHALAIMCELLGAAMTGGVSGRDVNFPKTPGIVNNMLVILFDPARLGTGESFEREASGFIDWVRSARRDEVGQALGGILMPGEPEQRSRAARAERMPLDSGTLDSLRVAGETVAQATGRQVVDPLSIC